MVRSIYFWRWDVRAGNNVTLELTNIQLQNNMKKQPLLLLALLINSSP